MAQGKNSFRHESLQDKRSIKKILKAVTAGIGKGKLTFSDEDGVLEMEPEGLLNLKLKAERDETRNRVTIRITWQTEHKVTSKKLSVR